MPKELLMVQVGQPPVEDTVEDFWEDIKKKIGNHYYTTVPIGPNICIVVAENWQVVRNQPNSCGMYGPFFFARFRRDGVMLSLTAEQKRKCLRWYELKKDVPPPPEEAMQMRVITMDSTEYERFRQAQQASVQAILKLWHSL